MKKHLLFWFTVLYLGALCACASGADVLDSPAAETDPVPTGFRYEYISYWTAGQKSGDLTEEENSAAACMLAELDVDSAQVDTRRLGSSNCTVFALTLDDQDAVTQDDKTAFAAFTPTSCIRFWESAKTPWNMTILSHGTVMASFQTIFIRQI